MSLAYLRATAMALLMLSGFIPAAAQAGVPMAKTEPPGYYRLMLGDFEITALSDGSIALMSTNY